MKKIQSGFTIIELMIAVAIIGILAAIAIPAYSDYVNRAKVSEGLQIAAAAKTSVAEYRLSQGTFPADNASAGLSGNITGNYVKSVSVVDGKIVVTYSSDAAAGLPTGIAGNSIVFSPADNGGTISFKCTTMNSVTGTNGTQLNLIPVDSRYLPSNCR